MPAPLIAVIPAYLRSQGDLDLLLRCLVSLQATAPGTPVLVVDDASPERRAVAALESIASEVGAAVVANEENLGFAGTVNVGLELARAEGVDALLVNADIEFAFPGWLEALQARTDGQGRPAAVVGARLLFATRLLQHAGIYYSRLHRDFFHRFRYGPADLPEALEPTRCPVTAALQLIRHDTLTAVGLYDAAFGMAYEDVDFCLRVFAEGGECIYEPAAQALHLEKAFRDRPTARIQELHDRSVKRLWDKHGETDLSPWTPAVR